MTNFDEKDGVWRTMDNGQKIFIRKGEKFRDAYRRKLSMTKGKRFKVEGAERNRYEESEYQRRKKEQDSNFQTWDRETTKQELSKEKQLRNQGKNTEADEVRDRINRNAYHEDIPSAGDRKLKNIVKRRQLNNMKQKLEQEYDKEYNRLKREGKNIQHEGREIKATGTEYEGSERLDKISDALNEVRRQLNKIR